MRCSISDYDLLVYLINEHKLFEDKTLIGLDGLEGLKKGF